jgi:hypothetical protein
MARTGIGADQRALAYVKTYLSVVPPSPARAKELSTASEGVPVLEPGKCKTVCRHTLRTERTPGT